MNENNHHLSTLYSGNFFVHIRKICYSVTMYVMGPKIFSNIVSPSVVAD